LYCSQVTKNTTKAAKSTKEKNIDKYTIFTSKRVIPALQKLLDSTTWQVNYARNNYFIYKKCILYRLILKRKKSCEYFLPKINAFLMYKISNVLIYCKQELFFWHSVLLLCFNNSFAFKLIDKQL